MFLNQVYLNAHSVKKKKNENFSIILKLKRLHPYKFKGCDGLVVARHSPHIREVPSLNP
jgi:hypothetical protein